ncbi:hypothetical protein GCM10023324_39760 [Streptomyces youssoufiensis]
MVRPGRIDGRTVGEPRHPRGPRRAPARGTGRVGIARWARAPWDVWGMRGGLLGGGVVLGHSGSILRATPARPVRPRSPLPAIPEPRIPYGPLTVPPVLPARASPYAPRRRARHGAVDPPARRTKCA